MLMMLYDFIPVLLFLVAFKWYGIYVATTVGIIATGIQVLTTLIWKKKVDKQQLITFVIFLVFGGLTLYFHNPLFVKWKPTIIFWIFASVFFLSHFIGEKPLIQRLMEKTLEEKTHVIPKKIWQKMNIVWTMFFILLGGLNLFIAYHFSTNAWVNFKFYGIFSCFLIFSILQALYFARYLNE